MLKSLSDRNYWGVQTSKAESFMDPQNEYMDGYMIYSSYIQMTTVGPRQLTHGCSLNGVFFFSFFFCTLENYHHKMQEKQK